MKSRILAGLSILAVPAALLSACGGGDAGPTAAAADAPTSAAPAVPATIWVSSWWDDSVSEIDPATGEVTGTADVYAPNDISIGTDVVWSEGSRIDPTSFAAEAVDESYPDAVAAADGGAWFAYTKDNSSTGGPSVRRYDDATGEFGEPIDLGLAKDWSTVQLVAVDGVLYGLGWDDRVFRLDTTTGEVVLSEDPDAYISQLTVTDDAVWAPSGDSVLQLSPDDLSTVHEYTEPGSAWPLALDVADDGTIWVADDEGDLRQLDPAAGTFGEPVALPESKSAPSDLEVVEGTAWVLRGNQLFGDDPSTGEPQTTLEIGTKKNSTYRLVAG